MAHCFIGVDLAWAVDARHTAVAVMNGDRHGIGLASLSSDLRSLDRVAAFVTAHAADHAVVAIDASLIVNNVQGQRPCEAQIGRTFGRQGASCHSTNRSRMHWDSGPRLVERLEQIGFGHGLPLSGAKGRSGRWFIEVYPHPAMIRLFGLDRIIGYKKGRIEERRAGLRRVQRHLDGLSSPTCGLDKSPAFNQLLAIDPATLEGRALKQHEDDLDAVFCAYLAWYCWRWGEERNGVFGDMECGYIVVPR